MGCACGWSWPEVFRRGWQADLGAVRPGLAAVPIHRLAGLTPSAWAEQSRLHPTTGRSESAR